MLALLVFTLSFIDKILNHCRHCFMFCNLLHQKNCPTFYINSTRYSLLEPKNTSWSTFLRCKRILAYWHLLLKGAKIDHNETLLIKTKITNAAKSHLHSGMKCLLLLQLQNSTFQLQIRSVLLVTHSCQSAWWAVILPEAEVPSIHRACTQALKKPNLNPDDPP